MTAPVAELNTEEMDIFDLDVRTVQVPEGKAVDAYLSGPTQMTFADCPSGPTAPGCYGC